MSRFPTGRLQCLALVSLLLLQPRALAWRASSDDADHSRLVELVVRHRHGFEQATVSLTQLRPAFVPRILGLICGEEPATDVPIQGPLVDSDTRRMLIQTIAGWPTSEVMIELTAAIDEDSSRNRRMIALEIAGEVADGPRVLGCVDLLAGMGPDELQTRMVLDRFEKTISSVLARDPSALRVLTDGMDEFELSLIPAIASAVSASGDPQALVFINGLLHKNDALDMKLLDIASRWSPSVYDDDGLSVIASFLSSPNPVLRQRAVVALGKLGGTAYVPELLQLEVDVDARVTTSAHWAMQQLSGLGWQAGADWYSWYDAEAAWFDERAELLADRVLGIDVGTAAEALREIGDHPVFAHEMVYMLQPALRHADETIAAATCGAFLRFKARDIEGLLTALEDGRTVVRQAAWNTLRLLTGKDLPAEPLAWRNWYGS